MKNASECQVYFFHYVPAGEKKPVVSIHRTKMGAARKACSLMQVAGVEGRPSVARVDIKVLTDLGRRLRDLLAREAWEDAVELWNQLVPASPILIQTLVLEE